MASGQTSESDIWQLSLYEASGDGSGSSLANTVGIGDLSREMLFFVLGEEGIITWAVVLPKEKWLKSWKLEFVQWSAGLNNTETGNIVRNTKWQTNM